MFKCVIYQNVVATDGSAVGDLEFELPFPPHPGIMLSGMIYAEDSVEFDAPEPILAVTYSARYGVFFLTVEDDDARQSNMTLSEAKRLYHPEFEWEDYAKNPNESDREGSHSSV